MTYDPDAHHRKSIRLKGFDYSRAGWYFVTICVQDRVCLFGNVVDGRMNLNDAGKMVQAVWNEMPGFYPGVKIDRFVVMPNHVHGIVNLVGAAPCGRPLPDPNAFSYLNGEPDRTVEPCPVAEKYVTGDVDQSGELGQARGPAPTVEPFPIAGPGFGGDGGQPVGMGSETRLSLPDVVHRFKTMTTKRYCDGVEQSGWTRFRGRLWQRNYHEHIIRDEPSLNRIRHYIEKNPLRWAFDDKNPRRGRS